jgi:hypothetical protein
MLASVARAMVLHHRYDTPSIAFDVLLFFSDHLLPDVRCRLLSTYVPL